VHLVGFIIRIYHDARSCESQTQIVSCFQAYASREHNHCKIPKHASMSFHFQVTALTCHPQKYAAQIASPVPTGPKRT